MNLRFKFINLATKFFEMIQQALNKYAKGARQLVAGILDLLPASITWVSKRLVKQCFPVCRGRGASFICSKTRRAMSLALIRASRWPARSAASSTHQIPMRSSVCSTTRSRIGSSAIRNWRYGRRSVCQRALPSLACPMRTTNGLERLNKELKRRTRVATLFPNSGSCLRLVSALLAEQDESG